MPRRLFSSFTTSLACSKCLYTRAFIRKDVNKYHSNNTKQFCDILANKCGYKVVMPDFFRGDYWTPEKMGDMQALLAWIGKVGSIEVVCLILQKRKVYCVYSWYVHACSRLLLKSSLLLNGFRVKVSLRLVLSASAGVLRFVWKENNKDYL